MISTKTKKSLGITFEIANQVRLVYLRLKYKGTGVECVCCGSKFRSFAPFGVTPRPNAWCPKCESLERHRLLWKFLQEETNLLTSNSFLLHSAPEKIFFKSFKKLKNLNYYPADILPVLNPRGTHYMDLTKIEFDDNTFDAVICNHVLQYIRDDRKAMSEVFRVLKPGGWVIFTVPVNYNLQTTFEDDSITEWKEREKVFGLAEHLRNYGLDLKEKLEGVGFEVSFMDYSKNFSDEELHKFGFVKGDPMYFCTKKSEALIGDETAGSMDGVKHS